MESMVAMLLVAVIVGGVFSAVMAARRAIAIPSQKEDIAYAAESINNALKMTVSGYSGDGAGAVFGVESPLYGSPSDKTITDRTNLGLTSDCTATYKITDESITIDATVQAGAGGYTLKRANINVTCNDAEKL